MAGDAITCARCAAPMAADQRYCLECGQRRGDPRVDFVAMLRPAAVVRPVAASPRASWSSVLPTPRVAAACVLVVLGFGVILGAAGTGPVESSLASANRALTIVLPPVQSVAPPATTTPEPPASSPAPSTPVSSTPPTPVGVAPTAPVSPAPSTDTPVTNGGDETPTGPQYPGIKHVWVIVTPQQSPAPYTSTDLTAQGTLLTGYKAVTTGSLANTIALVSGQNPNPDTQADCPTYKPVDPGTVDDDGQAQGSGCVYSQEVYTLPDQLVAAGQTWKAYVEGIGTPCRHPDLGADDPWQQPRQDDPYVTHRNPFVYFQTITSSPDCATEIVGTDVLDADLADKKTPNLSFIIPAQPAPPSDPNAPPPDPAAVQTALKDTVAKITASAAYKKDGLIVITSDTSDPATPDDSRIGALLISRFVEKGGSFDTEYDHLSLLKTLAGIFALRELGAAQKETVKAFAESVFASSSQDVHQSATRR
jgi:phosphatidylinositol-3-phosphatase